jgi:hypothetical protein
MSSIIGKALQRKLGAPQYFNTCAMNTEQAPSASTLTIAERLQNLAESVEKFARAVENGEIAPPRRNTNG